jgi:succinoglycan biosynthesis protein ExoV
MPHFQSAARGAWHLAAGLAGVRLIDPRGSPGEILQAIGRCKLLLSEALHGVIVADALRVPWVAIRPRVRVHRAKWADWADTMELRPRFHGLPASSLPEWAGGLPLGSFHMGRMWLDRQDRRHETIPAERMVTRAGNALRLTAQAPPQLSAEHVLDRCQSRMLDAVQAIRTNPLRGVSRAAHPRSSLQTVSDSAYQLKMIG